MSLTIGKLDTRIKFQTSRTTADAQGSPVEEWRDSAAMWAEIENLNAGESTNGNAREADAEVRFTVRYQRVIAGYGPRFRIRCRHQNYDVLSVIPFPNVRPDRIILTARRLADDAARRFDTYYFLNGEGGRFSNNEGGFFRVGAEAEETDYFLNGEGGRFLNGSGGFLRSN